MLQTQTVAPGTLELLKSLQAKAYLEDFVLVGGTALALHWGHRQSIDLDLFTNKAFDAAMLLEKIQQDYALQLMHTAESTIKASINDVNVDFIAHRYPYIKPVINHDGIMISSVPDVLAMKLNAIATSGQRSKDFIDVYWGLKTYSLGEMVAFYKEKYKQEHAGHIVKSLIWFSDADSSDWPVMLKESGLQWADVTQHIQNQVTDFSRRQ